MRCVYTIIYNGLHHLKHKGYAEYLASNVDLWVIADGLAGNSGSTSWCKNLEGSSSDDGTIEYIQELQKKHPNIILETRDKKWASKDEMINRAVEIVRSHTKRCYLWQVDCDEQWTAEMMTLSELALIEANGKTGCFHANYYLGESLRAFGTWGEGVGYPYNRLWNWEGEYFLKHEPPTLLRGNGKTVLLPYKFEHYAYYFDKDVEFKSRYYSGHEKIYENWKKLNKGHIRVPCELKTLFGHNKGVFQNTTIRAI